MGAVLQAQTDLVTKEHLELAVTKPTFPVSFALRNEAEDKERILRALKQANGNRNRRATRNRTYTPVQQAGRIWIKIQIQAIIAGNSLKSRIFAKRSYEKSVIY